MKTERRHELQTNVLADRLARGADVVRPYGKIILGVVLLVLLSVVVLSFWNSRQRQRAMQGWDEFFGAMLTGNESDLEKTASEYQNTPVGDWAKLIQADMDLAQATELLFTDRAAAREKLKDAVEMYQGLRDSKNEVIQQRATFGLAEAHESRGELEKAREEYDSLVQHWPNSAYARTARQRSLALNKQTTKQFYDWLAQYTPATPASKLPGVPGIGPSFDKGLDNEMSTSPGDVSLPSFLDNKSRPGDSADPASSTDSPAESAPSETPATDTPSADDAGAATPDASTQPDTANDTGDKAPGAAAPDADSK
jgi:hypothetical protein